MNDYIKRSDAIKTVCGDCEYYSTNDCEDCRLDRLTKIPAADVRPVVLCRDCKHAPEPDESDYGLDVRFPDDACPFNCPDHWYNVRPAPEFFCANGERRKEEP